MAVAKNSVVLHNVRGKIGNLVVKHIKGRTVVSAMPKGYRKSKSEAAVNERKKFGATVKLAKSVNAIPELKEAWNMAKIPGLNSYLKIMSSNAKKSESGKLTTSNIITPEGLHLEIIAAEISENNLVVTFLSAEANKIQFPASLFVIFNFQENGKFLYSLMSQVEELTPGQNFTATLPLDFFIKVALKKDPNPIIFAALSGAAPSKKKVFWTSSSSIRV